MNNNLVPFDWQRIENTNEIKYIASSKREAILWLVGAEKHLKKEATTLNKKVVVSYNQSVVHDEFDPTENKLLTKGSYGISKVDIHSSMEEIFLFILENCQNTISPRINHQASDKYLLFMNWQSLDGLDDLSDNAWVGIDSKSQWVDSFKPGNTNYYGILKENLEKDGKIPAFHYKIRQPSGFMSECQGDYYRIIWNGEDCRLSIHDRKNSRLLG